MDDDEIVTTGCCWTWIARDKNHSIDFLKELAFSKQAEELKKRKRKKKKEKKEKNYKRKMNFKKKKNAPFLSWCFTSTKTVRLIRDGRMWGKREIIYLSMPCHHQNDSCVKVDSDESHFNV